MINSRVHKQIIILLCECILQSRINVERAQINSFNTFISKIKNSKERTFQRNLQLLLDSIILKQRKQPRQKFSNATNPYQAAINFSLKHKNQGNLIPIQSWFLTLEIKHPNTENCHETFLATALIFEEMLFFLTNQPLFIKFVRDTKMKQQYQISYNLNTTQYRSQQQFLQRQKSLQFGVRPLLYYKHRTCKCYNLKIYSSFAKEVETNNLKAIKQIQVINSPQKTIRQQGHIYKQQLKLKSRYSTEDKIQKNPADQDFVDLQIHRGRKQSLYEMYDDSLDCIMVSSNQSYFCSSPKSSIKQINFFSNDVQFVQAEDEFQMLDMSQDQKFINDNQNLFNQFSKLQHKAQRLFN